MVNVFVAVPGWQAKKTGIVMMPGDEFSRVNMPEQLSVKGELRASELDGDRLA